MDWDDPRPITECFQRVERTLADSADPENELGYLVSRLETELKTMKLVCPSEFFVEADNLFKCAALLHIHRNPRKKFLVARKKDGNHKVIEISAECNAREDAEKVASVLSSTEQVAMLKDEYRKSHTKVYDAVKSHLDKYDRTDVPHVGINAYWKWIAMCDPALMVEKIFYRTACFAKENNDKTPQEEKIVARVVSASKHGVELDVYAREDYGPRHYQRMTWFPEMKMLRLSRHWPDHRFKCLFDVMPLVESRFEEEQQPPGTGADSSSVKASADSR